MNFRKLRADEIDCRVAMIKENGLSLLLYKDARVDMRVLDETVGSDRWNREHVVINGNLFCTVGIYFPERGEWVYKQDVGVESNTEKEKGQASDSFKRACFNWGIGRELYSAPFIWINSEDYESSKTRNGTLGCKNHFEVSEIGYNERGDIDHLVIRNVEKRRIVYTLGTPKTESREMTEDEKRKLLIEQIEAMAAEKGYSVDGMEKAPTATLAATVKKLENAPKKGGNK